MASEQQVKRLQEEKAKLTEEAERAKNIIKTSEACKDLITYIADNHKKDPFVDPGTCLLFLFAWRVLADQPYTKKPGGGGGCTLF